MTSDSGYKYSESGKLVRMISVVCVYNNRKMLNSTLVRSLEEQTAKFELIAVDNTEGVFSSAAKALNWGGAKAHGEYIMFVHQDVDLCARDWLKQAEEILAEVSGLGMAGVAGMADMGRSNRERGRNTINHGNPARSWGWGNPITKPEPVQTLDECLMIVPKPVFDRLQFDETACDDWHLYAVDYCLSCRSLGLGCYALPLSVWHKSLGFRVRSKLETLKSLGPLPRPYYQTLRKVIKKHRRQYKYIYTTCGDFSTAQPLVLQTIRALLNDRANLIRKRMNGRRNGTT